MPRVDVDAGPTVKTQVYPGSLMAMNDGRIVHTWNILRLILGASEK